MQTSFLSTELKTWKFTLDQTEVGLRFGWEKPEWDDSCWSDAESYTCWETYESALSDYEGCGWFRTRYTPKDASLRQILHFDGIGGVCKVYVNGKYAGGYENRYLPFELDITEFVLAGQENLIAVLVDNSYRGVDHLTGGKKIEWVLYGGLTHHVRVEERPYFCISHIRVDAAADKTARATVTVENLTESAVSGTVSVSVAGLSCDDEQTVELAAGETKKLTFCVKDESAKLWSPEEPNLYTFRAELSAEGQENSFVESRIGFRTISVEGTKILLNGKGILLKGANRYDEYAPYGICPPTEKIREDLLYMKSLGMNLVRTHYPQDPIHYEIADEIGIMYMIEVPVNWWKPEPDKTLADYEGFKKEAMDTLEETFFWFCNHACWTVWSTGNECPHAMPACQELFRLLAARMRELECKKIITYAMYRGISSSNELDFCDVISLNVYSGSLSDNERDFDTQLRPILQEKLDQLTQFHPDKPHVLTEFGVCTIYGMHGSGFEGRFTEEFGANFVGESCKIHVQHENMRGLIIWSWADYRHRRGFCPDNPGSSAMHLSATYGPYGIVTMDRKVKKPMADTMKKVFADFDEIRGDKA